MLTGIRGSRQQQQLRQQQQQPSLSQQTSPTLIPITPATLLARTSSSISVEGFPPLDASLPRREIYPHVQAPSHRALSTDSNSDDTSTLNSSLISDQPIDALSDTRRFSLPDYFFQNPRQSSYRWCPEMKMANLIGVFLYVFSKLFWFVALTWEGTVTMGLGQHWSCRGSSFLGIPMIVSPTSYPLMPTWSFSKNVSAPQPNGGLSLIDDVVVSISPPSIPHTEHPIAFKGKKLLMVGFLKPHEFTLHMGPASVGAPARMNQPPPTPIALGSPAIPAMPATFTSSSTVRGTLTVGSPSMPIHGSRVKKDTPYPMYEFKVLEGMYMSFRLLSCLVDYVFFRLQ